MRKVRNFMKNVKINYERNFTKGKTDGNGKNFLGR